MATTLARRQMLNTTTGATPDPTDGPYNNDNNNFSPVPSSPLIIACLAVGGFTAVMIVLFSWRRLRGSRSWTLGDEEDEFESEKAVPKIKPKLWDLVTDEEVGSWESVSLRGGQGYWASTMVSDNLSS